MFSSVPEIPMASLLEGRYIERRCLHSMQSPPIVLSGDHPNTFPSTVAPAPCARLPCGFRCHPRRLCRPLCFHRHHLPPPCHTVSTSRSPPPPPPQAPHNINPSPPLSCRPPPAALILFRTRGRPATIAVAGEEPRRRLRRVRTY